MTNAEGPHVLEPVHAADGEADGKQWSYRLVVFLRVMAVISLCKGLYHWAVICGIGAPFPSGFDSYSTPYQVATVFFAIKHAILAARKDAGDDSWFELQAPATVNRVRQACIVGGAGASAGPRLAR